MLPELQVLLSLVTIAYCHPDARPLMTPAPALPDPFLHPRQFDSSYLAQTCGYIDAYILSPLGCYQGSVCVEERTLGLAGGCCRLADVSSNCFLPTSCVPQASLSASCDSACSEDIRVTKCDDAQPYCYTNYWVADGSTPTEVGCTSTQGFFAYVYSSYTKAGSNFSPTTRVSPVPQTATSSSVASNTGTLDSSQQISGNGENDQTSNPGSETTTNNSNGGESVPVGAIAGGVVGGVAVLAIAAGLITWLCLRHRREQRRSAGLKAGDPTPGAIVRKPVPEQHMISPVGSAELAHDQNYRPSEVDSNAKTHAHELLGRRAVPELP
ncbi:uncharacterized protein RCC_01949 [Ramularia collo-cygni]|uniref:Mid2 domain-containing protein n=1 Tax=Ramularia collo-cygni TaxID=112498 RepID=A0A2D3UPX1_9PEZI|nr:uncharacterized protein RCC_01949 [Ramularia collo-cygni]CZT16108.1 uncharacterized protein RCC_01949 [Ramularia collo-cygni]